MIKLLLLYAAILTGVTFLVIPDTIQPIDYFLFSDIKLYLKTYVYFIFEKLIVLVLAYIVAAEERQFRFETQVFFWLMVADLFDYLLSYGAIWFTVGVVPISMNVVKALVFGVVILQAWKKSIGA